MLNIIQIVYYELKFKKCMNLDGIQSYSDFTSKRSGIHPHIIDICFPGVQRSGDRAGAEPVHASRQTRMGVQGREAGKCGQTEGSGK